MRKIETAMNNAIIRLSESRRVNTWELDNTRVESDTSGSVFVYLHGNNIAFYDARIKQWKINLCGWDSRTTRSRIGALCYRFSNKYTGVSSRKGITRLEGYAGEPSAIIESSGWNII